MSKGISPLVAAVLLIAVTMTIAGMLAYWASSFVQTQTTRFENQTIIGPCTYADFRIYQCTYNTTSSGLTLILENIRNIELSNLKLYALYPNGTLSVGTDLNGTLSSGAFISYKVTNVQSGFSKIIVKTNCPDLSRESSCKLVQ